MRGWQLALRRFARHLVPVESFLQVMFVRVTSRAPGFAQCAQLATGGVAARIGSVPSGFRTTDRLGHRRADCLQGGLRHRPHTPHHAGARDELEIVKIHDRRLGKSIGRGEFNLGGQATNGRRDRSNDHRVQQTSERVASEDHDWAPFVQFSQPDLASSDRWYLQRTRGHAASQSVSSARSLQSGAT